MRLLKTLRVFSTLHTPSAATSFDPLPAERRTYAALACIDLGGCHRFASRRLAGARAIDPAQAEGLRMWERAGAKDAAQAEGLRMRLLKTLRVLSQ